jgi:hypothetical protein
MNDFYVYILFDWQGIPRYVGKGCSNRWLDHERRTDLRNWMKNEFIEQTWALLEDVPKIKIAEGLSEESAYSLEASLIVAIGRFPSGPLVNLTDGGSGPRGHHRPHKRLSASHRAALSLAQKRRWKNQSDDQRVALLANLIAHKPWKPEDRERRANSLRGRKITKTPKWLAYRESLRGVSLPANHRAHMSAAQFRRWATTESSVERDAKISATKQSLSHIMLPCPDCGKPFKMLGLELHRTRKHRSEPATGKLGI